MGQKLSGDISKNKSENKNIMGNSEINESENKNNEIAKLTVLMHKFQNNLFDFTNEITQKNALINQNELTQILRFYSMLDDFIMNVESLKYEVERIDIKKN